MHISEGFVERPAVRIGKRPVNVGQRTYRLFQVFGLFGLAPFLGVRVVRFASRVARALLPKPHLVAALVALATSALAQNAPVPTERPATGSVQNDDTMTDIDPEVLARCKREAAQQKLKGSERATFMNACVEPED
jgi:hypothetical protein